MSGWGNRRGGRQYGSEPPTGSERDDRGDGLTDLEIENRLTKLETQISNWRWMIAVGVAALGAAAAIARIFGP